MSEPNGNFDIFDPTGMFKSVRDANMEAWSRMMIQLVNTEAYSQAIGTSLDAWLTASAPFRKALEQGMASALSSANLPSRADFISLAERLTNLEMRLDDTVVWSEPRIPSSPGWTEPYNASNSPAVFP